MLFAWESTSIPRKVSTDHGVRYSPSVVSYFNRKRALRNDMTRYICCNGDCPCSGRMSEQSCPEACLCAEARTQPE